MALEELFVPNMPELYGAAAQFLRNPINCKDNSGTDKFVTLQPSRQFHVHQKLYTWRCRAIGTAAGMRCLQAVRRASGSHFRE
jgi:hypothetical protein